MFKPLLSNHEASKIAFDALDAFGVADKGIAVRDLNRMIRDANIDAQYQVASAADIFESMVSIHILKEISTTDEA